MAAYQMRRNDLVEKDSTYVVLGHIRNRHIRNIQATVASERRERV